jgi:polar amino acid transport system permease protein
MSPGRTMIFIVLPQAFRIVIPPITNEFVLLIKDTSLLFIAGSTLMTKEITTFARDAVSSSGNATPLIMGGMLYLFITIPLTRLVAKLERRMARSR